MHPVNPPLHECHVAGDQQHVRQNASNVPVDAREARRGAALGQALDDRGQESIEGHGPRGDPDLLEDSRARGHGEAGSFFARAGEEGRAEDEVDVVDPDPFF